MPGGCVLALRDQVPPLDRARPRAAPGARPAMPPLRRTLSVHDSHPDLLQDACLLGRVRRNLTAQLGLPLGVPAPPRTCGAQDARARSPPSNDRSPVAVLPSKAESRCWRGRCACPGQVAPAPLLPVRGPLSFRRGWQLGDQRGLRAPRPRQPRGADTGRTPRPQGPAATAHQPPATEPPLDGIGIGAYDLHGCTPMHQAAVPPETLQKSREGRCAH